MPIDQGTPVPDVAATASDGTDRPIPDLADDAPALVVGFVAASCETSRAYEDRILQLADGSPGVPVVLVDPVPGERDGFAELVDADGLTYLLDVDRAAAEAFGVERTPHFFVFDADRRLLYDGRFDDAWRDPDRVMRHYIEEALEVALGKRDHLELDRTLPVGTPIP